MVAGLFDNSAQGGEPFLVGNECGSRLETDITLSQVGIKGADIRRVADNNIEDGSRFEIKPVRLDKTDVLDAVSLRILPRDC